MAARPCLARRAAVALAWRPEWPAVVVVAVAWAALAVAHAGASSHHAHAVHTPQPVTAALTLGAAVTGWTLMSTAMMLPATLPAVRHVGLNSIRRRRWWAITVYLTAYLAVWAAFGLLALLLVWAGSAAGLDDRQLVPGTLATAAAWQLTPWKRRALVACRRTVALPPTGRRADAACARFGVRQARRCVVSCWPLMLLMAVTGHTNLAPMAALTILILAEERAPTRGRLLVPTAAALAATATLTVLLN